MAKNAVTKSTKPGPRRINAVKELIIQLRALDKQFRKFDALLRAKMRSNPELAVLRAELDKTRAIVSIPAYGRLPQPRRRQKPAPRAPESITVSSK
jgi:hypothetical protein